ncbi:MULTISPECIES: hypothetical protein [Prochlorococcus]|uniref:hypothetical protein n=1 Tax=Prochlorococcus TaxID=1218 RepID=UPI000533ADAF|nr:MULTISPECIES: hypothetical protein [Prochlorococcus]KGG12508.1 hypothetical protein EV05_1720 [Prochlorococcus sp. MIT 0601]
MIKKTVDAFMRMLTTETRRKIEIIIKNLEKGENVTLKERIELNKYATHIPFIAGKVNQAMRMRSTLEEEGLI